MADSVKPGAQGFSGSVAISSAPKVKGILHVAELKTVLFERTAGHHPILLV